MKLKLNFDKISEQAEIKLGNMITTRGILISGTNDIHFRAGPQFYCQTEKQLSGGSIGIRADRSSLSVFGKFNQLLGVVNLNKDKIRTSLWSDFRSGSFRVNSKITLQSTPINPDLQYQPITHHLAINTKCLRASSRMFSGLELVPTSPSISAVAGIDLGTFGVFTRKTLYGQQDTGIDLVWW